MPFTTEHRDEIQQLMYRYNHAMDSGDSQGWAGCFTDDGTFDTGGRITVGRPALEAFASGVQGPMLHLIANPIIDIRGSVATVRADCVVYRGTSVLVTGVYEDEVVHTSSGWLFAKRRFTTSPSS